MGGSIFGSSSDTKARATDNSAQASDQAVIYQPKSSGNNRNVGNVTNKVAKGGALNIYNGVGVDEFNAGLSTLAQSLLANTTRVQEGDAAFRSTVLDALDRRTVAGTDKAVDEITGSSSSTIKKYVLAAVGVVVIVALALAFGGRKKS